jgi:hypothetical protein
MMIASPTFLEYVHNLDEIGTFGKKTVDVSVLYVLNNSTRSENENNML